MHWLGKHLKTAEKLVDEYKGDIPLHLYLKKYFASNKKHGSKDRKTISHLCYTFYRLGRALPALAFGERIQVSLFLCEHELHVWKDLFEEDLYTRHSPALMDRINIINNMYPAFDLKDVFPLPEHIGDIDMQAFLASHFMQPLTFLRIRPGKKLVVMNALRSAELPFQFVDEDSIALAPNAKLQDILQINDSVVIQDISSQKIADYFLLINKEGVHTIYDCCSGSGGKSILAHDHFRDANISVSDKRPSIIHNLMRRMKEAKINVSDTRILDLTKETNSANAYNLVICDAPCTGSGTWARSPEQLSFFTSSKILYYSRLQQAIIPHAIASVADGGYFLYITCSVFKEENEYNTRFIEETFPEMQCVQAGYIAGYDQRANTLYAAMFKKK